MYRTTAPLRGRFTEESISTASGPRIIVMCFDRIDRDLSASIDAIERHDLSAAHESLCHAQEIVQELLYMLDLDSWEHAGRLAAIYMYVDALLTRANVAKSVTEAAEARRLMAELGDGFRGAAIGLSAEAAAEFAEPATRFSVKA
jgi:flagellar secretion chaperone FliS